jgi:hypothetical protein
MPVSGSIHGSRSTNDLSVLGACLLLLPWVIFSLGVRGLYLYLSLALCFTVIMVCLQYRELRRRLWNGRPTPQPLTGEPSNQESAHKSPALKWQETQESQIVSAMVTGCSNWRTMSDEEFAEWFRNLKLKALDATESESTRQARALHVRQAQRDIQFKASALGRFCLGGAPPTADELIEDAIRRQPRRSDSKKSS